jgi:hypothetical protein
MIRSLQVWIKVGVLLPSQDIINPDGMVELAKNTFLFLIFLEEIKNEVGDGGSDSDPSTHLFIPQYEKLRNASA